MATTHLPQTWMNYLNQNSIVEKINSKININGLNSILAYLRRNSSKQDVIPSYSALDLYHTKVDDLMEVCVKLFCANESGKLLEDNFNITPFVHKDIITHMKDHPDCGNLRFAQKLPQSLLSLSLTPKLQVSDKRSKVIVAISNRPHHRGSLMQYLVHHRQTFVETLSSFCATNACEYNATRDSAHHVLEVQKQLRCWVHAIHCIFGCQFISEQNATILRVLFCFHINDVHKYGNIVRLPNTDEVRQQNYFARTCRKYPDDSQEEDLAGWFRHFMIAVESKSHPGDGLYSNHMEAFCRSMNDPDGAHTIYVGRVAFLDQEAGTIEDYYASLQSNNGNCAILFVADKNALIGHYITMKVLPSSHEKKMFLYDSMFETPLEVDLSHDMSKYFGKIRDLHMFAIPDDQPKRKNTLSEVLINLNDRAKFILTRRLFISQEEDGVDAASITLLRPQNWKDVSECNASVLN